MSIFGKDTLDNGFISDTLFNIVPNM